MADTSAFTENDRMLMGKNYHFFNRADHIGRIDYPDYYGYLLSIASQSVKVWDPYFNVGDEVLFSRVQAGVDITILYMYNSRGGGYAPCPTAAAVKSSVEAHLPLVHGAVKVAYLPTSDATLFDERKWHDRFLILDDTLVFLVGGSLAYQRSSAKCFGIYDIEEDEDAALVIERFEKTLYEVSSKGYVVI